MLPVFGLPAFAQGEATNPTPAESLDFTAADGITYTILNEQEKTCQTKAGYSYINYEKRQLEFVYGNSLQGAITIPASVQNPNTSETYTVVAMGNYGFDQVSSVTIEAAITQISEYAFLSNKNLTYVSIPESVTSIGRNAFYNCTALTNITLPTTVTNIDTFAFSYTGLTSIELPENLISIGDNAFAYCPALQSLTIPGTVLQLGKSVFANCTGLSSLTIQEGVTSIPSYAFNGCNALNSVIIPASVNAIGDYGFNCSGLTSVTCLNKVIPAMSGNSFNSSSYANGTLYVYKTVLSNYENSQLWGKFTNIEPLTVAATGLSINPSTLFVNVGLTSQLSAVLVPEDATDDVTWSLVSATPANCIEVDVNGLVTAKQIGTGVVSASCNGITVNCDVIVNANPDESVVINAPSGNIYIGDSVTLSAVVFPTTITPDITWGSSNPDVATIDPKTGVLTALSDGGTVITATNDNITGSLALTVLPIEASSVTLNQENLTLKVGESQTLKATVLPENTTYKNVTWESNDPSVVMVVDGVVTAIGVGSANVRAMVGQATANCTVTVNPVEAENITLSASSATLKIGQTLQLIANVTPENTTDKSINWLSDNQNCATVSTQGEVIAISEGTAVITAECGNVTATCTITVEPITSEQLVMNYTAVTLKVGGTQQLTADIYPADTTDKNIVWSTSESSVATVSNGLVTAIAVGTTTITAQNGSQTATCLVTVDPILAEQVILSETNVSVNVGASLALSASVYPVETTDQNIVWASLNDNIATVANGVVTGVAPGSTVITATCGSVVASCNVTVLLPATSVTLNETTLDMFVGDIFDLIETVTPANTTDLTTWSSSDEYVSTVDNNGIVTALKAGSAVITVNCGEKSATCEVNVSDVAATNVELDFTALELMAGQAQQLSATVYPQNTTFPVVNWATSDSSVATVSAEGLVTAIASGTATITATCGNAVGECTVTVTTPEPDQIVLNYQTYGLKAAETVQLEVINPENVIATEVSWTSSDNKIATVSNNGLVTAVGVGEATITATYNNSSVVCTIVVNPTLAESVVLNVTELNLELEDTIQLTATVMPETTTDNTVVWTSSNTDVATVTEDGEVTAVGYGVATITAQCGNVYATCIVNVLEDSSSRVENINTSAADGIYRVYTIQGFNVMVTKEATDLNKLNPGLYIINNKKVVIR